MLAARDQENLVHGHQQAAAVKPLNQTAKTPGNRYPKTPLKIPLRDENAPEGLGGKSVLGTKGKSLGNDVTFDKNAFVTPMGPLTRAPLGQKTTNAKAKAFQTPSGLALDKSPEKTQLKPTSTRPKPKPVEKVKLSIPADDSPLHAQDYEPEYAPPRPKDLPYESDVFPDGCLNYNVIKGKNLMRGWQKYHMPQVDENGKTKMEREMEEGKERAMKRAEEALMKSMEEPWTVGDVPETFRHLRKKPEAAKANTSKPIARIGSSAVPKQCLGTVAARKAASALAVQPKNSVAPARTTAPKPKPSFMAPTAARPAVKLPPTSATTHTSALATSKSTLGYTKGRSASSALRPTTSSKPSSQPPNQQQKRLGGLQRSTSTFSTESDATITPERWAERNAKEQDDLLARGWLDRFRGEGEDGQLRDVDENEGLRGGEIDWEEDDGEDFVLRLEGE